MSKSLLNSRSTLQNPAPVIAAPTARLPTNFLLDRFRDNSNDCEQDEEQEYPLAFPWREVHLNQEVLSCSPPRRCEPDGKGRHRRQPSRRTLFRGFRKFRPSAEIQRRLTSDARRADAKSTSLGTVLKATTTFSSDFVEAGRTRVQTEHMVKKFLRAVRKGMLRLAEPIEWLGNPAVRQGGPCLRFRSVATAGRSVSSNPPRVSWTLGSRG